MDSETGSHISQMVETSSVGVAVGRLKIVIPTMFAELINLRKLIKVHEPGWVNEYNKLKETMTATSNSLTKSYARNIEL